MDGKDFLSACIVTYNDFQAAERVCRSLLEFTKKYNLKLYVVDNASSDGTADRLSCIEGITVIRNSKNIGFGAAHNKVLDLPLGKYHFVVNPDIEIKEDVLSGMADFMEQNPDVAMMMPRICNQDGSEQKLPKERPTFKRLFLGRLSGLGGVFGKIRDQYVWTERPVNKVTDIRFCSGCFFCMPREVFIDLGGFDERYFMYMEDADLTLRALKMGRVVINPDFEVTHIWQRESAKSIKYLLIHIISSIKFLCKWRKLKE